MVVLKGREQGINDDMKNYKSYNEQRKICALYKSTVLEF